MLLCRICIVQIQPRELVLESCIMQIIRPQHELRPYGSGMYLPCLEDLDDQADLPHVCKQSINSKPKTDLNELK